MRKLACTVTNHRTDTDGAVKTIESEDNDEVRRREMSRYAKIACVCMFQPVGVVSGGVGLKRRQSDSFAFFLERRSSRDGPSDATEQDNYESLD